MIIQEKIQILYYYKLIIYQWIYKAQFRKILDLAINPRTI